MDLDRGMAMEMEMEMEVRGKRDGLMMLVLEPTSGQRTEWKKVDSYESFSFLWVLFVPFLLL